LFLGDYQALASASGRFVTLFTITTSDPADRTDIETALPTALARDAVAMAARRDEAPNDADATLSLRHLRSDALATALARRWPGWKRPNAPR